MADNLLYLKDAAIYQGNNLILSDVTVSVDKGEFVYLIGKTGTGKVDLLKPYMAIFPWRKAKGKLSVTI